MSVHKAKFIVGLLALGNSVVAAPSTAPVEIQQYYSKFDGLMLKLDLRGLGRLYNRSWTNDCTFVSVPDKLNGMVNVYTKAMLLQRLIELKDYGKVTVSTSHLDHVKSLKGSFVVTVRSRLDFTSDKILSGHVRHTFGHPFVSDDTWIRVGGAWKLKQSKMITETAIRDGKVEYINGPAK